MNFRLKAFGLHLAASGCVLTLVLGALYLGWYRWPGWYLSGVLHVLMILLGVDLALGPTLTLIIANPRKPRRTLARDIALIGLVQLIALGYGAHALWLGRPLYYAFSVDSLQMVQASDLTAPELALAQKENPSLAPRWNSLPRWIWAPLPDDPQTAVQIAEGSVFGGQDVTAMPRYFKPWAQGLPQLRARLTPVASIQSLSRVARDSLAARITRMGLAASEPNAMIMWGASVSVIAVFDPKTLEIRALLKPY